MTVLSVFGADLTAQETTGSLRGRLKSTVAGPVSGARVVASSPDLLGGRAAVSGADGVFQLTLLPAGRYTLRITAIGHQPLVIRDAIVRLGTTTGLGGLTLEPSAIDLRELTVAAPPVTMDPVRTTVGGTLTADEYGLLPAARDYKAAIVILPHVNTSYHGDPPNAGGSTGLENVYFVDGVNVTTPLRGTGGTTLPHNFVRAVEVKAGGHEAQFGKALGATVNAVTYTGTNDLEAQVFGFFTHDALAGDSKSLPALRQTSAASYDVGIRVSGPVARDRLWFSAAYNPRFDRVDKDLPGLGIYTDATTAHVFAGKLTWRATPRTNVELSLFGDPATRQRVTPPLGASFATSLAAVNADPFLDRLESGGTSASLRATAALGTHGMLEAAVAHMRGDESMLAQTETGRVESLYEDLVAGTVSGGVGFIHRVSHGRTTGTLRATLSAGRHTLVGGVEYEDSWVSQVVDWSTITRRDTASWEVLEQATTGSYHGRVPIAYLQDAWRVTGRLTVSAGVRWSSQSFTRASGGIAQRFANEWQPRFGFSWQLGQAEQRVFGSFGRYYQQIPLNMAATWYGDFAVVVSSYSSDPRQPGATPDAELDLSLYEEDWAKPIDGLAVENFDEFTLGYERLVAARHRFTVRGIRRALRSSFQYGLDPSLPQFWALGTPGSGDLSFLPPPRREYTALEIGLEGSAGDLDYRTSYVLSRTWGNYTGLYGSDVDAANPGGNATFFTPWQADNSTGLLPNDRTHVFKIFAAYRSDDPLTVGGLFTVSSGIPQNEFGQAPIGLLFVTPRGSAGRTPALWDLNLRVAYEFPWRALGKARVVLDLLHIGSPRRPVQVDELRYFAMDASGQQSNPNPNYLRPSAYQPPITARLGVEVSLGR